MKTHKLTEQLLKKEKALLDYRFLKVNKNFYLTKDTFWSKDFITTASSRFLTSFLAPENATVINLLTKAGFFLLGKTALDEFACGGTGLLATTGPLENPYHYQHIPGGSSSGSAILVAKGLVPFALGTDTGDSVRRPAAYCGIIGFKPSYGIISRYGLIPMATSLDTVGILAKEVKITKKVFSVIAQPDPNDLLTITKKKIIAFKPTKKIAILQGLEKYLQPKLNFFYQQILTNLKKKGYVIQKVFLPKKISENLQLTYLALFSSEFVSHLNSLQGITYGRKGTNSITKKRSDNLGKIVKERLLIGAYFLESQGDLIKAKQLRSLVVNWTKKIFQKHDFLVFPSPNGSAPHQDNFSAGFVNEHWSDNLLLLANLAGLPSINLPIGFIDSLPVSINLNCAYNQDNFLLNFAELLENNLIKEN